MNHECWACGNFVLLLKQYYKIWPDMTHFYLKIHIFFSSQNYGMTLIQGLKPGFQNCPSNSAMIPKQPVQPILGISIHITRKPGSDPVLREKKEYSTMKAPFIDDNRCYGL